MLFNYSLLTIVNMKLSFTYHLSLFTALEDPTDTKKSIFNYYRRL